jgi:isopenicillin N synthase-like dioxygenase
MQGPATVDLAAYRAGRDVAPSAAALCASLRATGFVVVTGHGVDVELVRRAQSLFARFFALEPELRARYGGRAGGQRGYTPFGVERAVGHPLPDRKEFFHIGAEGARAKRANLPENVWPSEVPALRSACMELFGALERCAADLLGAIERGCDLPAESLSDLVRDGNHVLRAAHYPPRAPDTDARALRAAPHEDINLITLLCAATDAGLEIREADGRWVPVEIAPDALVADAGDMLARVTAGAIPATTHRVVDPPGGAARSRLSLPFFAHPRPDCELRVLDRFVGPDGPRHPPITAAAFLEERLRAIGLLDEVAD